MSGERDLTRLLAGMAPELDAERWRFCRAPAPVDGALATFREAEGWTLLLRDGDELPTGAAIAPGRYARITLTIHSSLEAVGLIAAVSATLASAGISCNVISAFHHDHLFVLEDRAEEALERLRRLARAGGGDQR